MQPLQHPTCDLGSAVSYLSELAGSGGAPTTVAYCCIVCSQNVSGCRIFGSLVSIAMSGKMQGRREDFSWGGQRSSAQGRESRRRGEWGMGRGYLWSPVLDSANKFREGVSLSPLAVGSGEKIFLNFYIKMVSSGAFWVTLLVTV